MSFTRQSFRRSVPARATQWLLAAIFCLGAFALRAEADSPPTITSFSPTSGPVGSQVTIEGTGFTVPFSVTFAGGVAAAGSFTSTQITVTVPSGAQTGPITVTTTGGSASTGVFSVGNSVPAPTITLATTTPKTTVGSGMPGVITLTLSTAAAADLKVDYSIGGTAANGTDYQLLKGTVKVKAGKTSKSILVVPEGDLSGASKKTVKLTLEPGSGYTVGDTTPGKVKIFPAGH